LVLSTSAEEQIACESSYLKIVSTKTAELPPKAIHTLVLYCVQERRNGLRLTCHGGVEIFSDGKRKLILTDSSPLFMKGHGRRRSCKARATEDELVIAGAECRWVIQAVRLLVGIEKFAIERRPVNLWNAKSALTTPGVI
jgi:hypothetical protein